MCFTKFYSNLFNFVQFFKVYSLYSINHFLQLCSFLSTPPNSLSHFLQLCSILLNYFTQSFNQMAVYPGYLFLQLDQGIPKNFLIMSDQYPSTHPRSEKNKDILPDVFIGPFVCEASSISFAATIDSMNIKFKYGQYDDFEMTAEPSKSNCDIIYRVGNLRNLGLTIINGNRF